MSCLLYYFTFFLFWYFGCDSFLHCMICVFLSFIVPTWKLTLTQKKEGNNPSSGDSKEDDENDPSKLSLAERVKLFNKKIVNDRLNQPVSIPRTVRSTRFKTQPVTNEEVSTAQEMNSVPSKLSRTASSILGMVWLFHFFCCKFSLYLALIKIFFCCLPFIKFMKVKWNFYLLSCVN